MVVWEEGGETEGGRDCLPWPEGTGMLRDKGTGAVVRGQKRRCLHFSNYQRMSLIPTLHLVTQLEHSITSRAPIKLGLLWLLLLCIMF